MRRLDRYIFRETLTPGILALVALTFVVSSRQVGFLVDILVKQNPSFSEVWAAVSALLPTLLSVTLPMALLVGLLTGLGRMSSDSEAIALRASGISIWRIFRPVLVLALLTWAVTLSLTVWIAPQNTARLRELRGQLTRRYPAIIDLRPRVFFERPNWNWLLYVNEFPPGGAGVRMRGILLIDTKKPDQPEVTFAESGSVVPYEETRTLQLTLSNSSKHVVSPTEPERSEIFSAESNTLSVPLPAVDTGSSIPVEELSTRELWERIRSGKAERAEYVQFHQRLALPFACIAFALLGLPLGITTNRGGRPLGLVLSLLLMFAYYLALAGGSSATRAESIPPWVSAWLPNVVFCALGLVLMLRADKHENRVLGSLTRALESTSRSVAAFKLGGLPLSRWAYTVSSRLRLFRLLDLYVLRGFWFFFVIVLGVLSSLFVVVTLFEILQDILKNGIGSATVATYIFFLLPQIFYWVAPLAVLLAVLINLGTLTKTNEVLAVKAGAISLYRMALPLVLMAGLLSAAVYAMQEYVLPRTNRIQDEYRDFIKNRAPQTYRDPHRKWMMGSASRLYHYSFFEPTSNAFANISIFNVNPQTFQLRERIYAKRAVWNGLSWDFDEGWVRRISEDNRVIHEEKFERMVINDIDPPSYFKKEVREADQMNYTELEGYVADLQRSGLDVSSLMVALYRKLSFPLVSLIMALIGIPFSFKTGRRGAFYGIGFCLAVGIVYWLTFELFGRLGGINQLSPAVAAWFPNLIFGASGLWLMLRVKT